jgi:D-lactate dehydrogenase
MVERLWGWSGEGALPIVVDAASCTGSIADPGEGVLSEQNAERLAKLEILDSVAWAHDRLLPWLEVGEKVGSATVHPTCASRQMGLSHRLKPSPTPSPPTSTSPPRQPAAALPAIAASPIRS